MSGRQSQDGDSGNPVAGVLLKRDSVSALNTPSQAIGSPGLFRFQSVCKNGNVASPRETFARAGTSASAPGIRQFIPATICSDSPLCPELYQQDGREAKKWRGGRPPEALIRRRKKGVQCF